MLSNDTITNDNQVERACCRNGSGRAKPARPRAGGDFSHFQSEVSTLLISHGRELPDGDTWRRLWADWEEYAIRQGKDVEFWDCLEHYTCRHPRPFPTAAHIIHRALPGWERPEGMLPVVTLVGVVE